MFPEKDDHIYFIHVLPLSHIRLIAFQDTWPKMEKWFSKFGILHKIEASQEQETVFTELDSMLEETLKKVGLHTIYK